MRRSEGSSPNRRAVLRGIAGGLAGLSLGSRRTRRPRGRQRHRRARGAGHHAAQRRRRQHRRARDGHRQSRRRQRRGRVRRSRARNARRVAGRPRHDLVQHPLASRSGRLERSASAARARRSSRTRRRACVSPTATTSRPRIATRNRCPKPRGRPRHCTPTTRLTVGGRRIEYGYLIEAHTDGDIYVAFPDANVIAVGDVVSPVARPRARLVRRRLARRTRGCAGAVARAQRCQHAVRAELRSRASAAPRSRPSTT